MSPYSSFSKQKKRHARHWPSGFTTTNLRKQREIRSLDVLHITNIFTGFGPVKNVHVLLRFEPGTYLFVV